MEKSRVFGLKCGESVASLDHRSSSWKMCQQSIFGDSQVYCSPWPKSGMMLNGQVYPLADLEHPTSAKDGSVLPTPSAHEHKYRLKGNSQASNCLEAQARTGRLANGVKGRLSPQFVEWMMGIPIGWTESKP